MKSKFFLLASLSAVVTASRPALATPVILDFDSVSAPCGFATASPPGSAYASSHGVTFSGTAEILNDCSSFSVSGYSAPNHLGWNSAAGYSPTVTMTFLPRIGSFTIGTASQLGGIVIVTAYDSSGAVVDTTTQGVSSTMSYASVSGVDIETVIVTASGSNGVYDNLSWNQLSDNDTDGFYNDTDCDDTDPLVNPGASESCNGIDDDCDGTTDEGDAIDALTWYADTDGDGYGDPLAGDSECTRPTGFVADDTDCDDTTASTYPGAPESCNTVDDDCDGTIDEDDAIDALTWYADTDADGFGDAAVSDVACASPTGFVADDTDCDDTTATTYPGAPEVPYDTIDQDCDGFDLCDVDDDGFDAPECEGTDCDDEDDTVYPEADETWYDGIDADCDEWSDYDADGDGFDSSTYGGDDCDDALDDAYPGAPDEPYDGVVQDCDGWSDYDADGDGFDSADHGSDDCDDANSDIRPDATETWYDGIDNNCDGNDDDQDEDGVGATEDCDDTDPTVLADCSSEDTGIDSDGDSGEPLDGQGAGGSKGSTCATASAPSALWLAGLIPLAWLRRRRA
jgi:hypothetical protein